jgi:hypothetical protein
LGKKNEATAKAKAGPPPAAKDDKFKENVAEVERLFEDASYYIVIMTLVPIS